MKTGSHHTPEAKEKIRQGLVKRWQNDADFRARQLAHLRSIVPDGVKASAAARSFRVPPKDSLTWRQFEKVRRILGSAAARTIL
jgi:hypothetical protein